MSIETNRRTVLGAFGCLGLAAVLAGTWMGVFRGSEVRAQDAPKAKSEAKADPALERTREQVKMLDDLYKTAVVAISQTYVATEKDVPAIMVAKQVFTGMRKKGWHSGRLVDATGDPFNDENSPATEFEKEAYKAIRAGQPYYEKVVGEGNNRRLLAATVVPAVIPGCIKCHHDKKVGDVLGFLRYEVPVK